MLTKDIVLFTSEKSKICQSCINAISGTTLPVKLFSIDSKVARDKVTRGKHFKIRVVPTLFITFADGNMQLYEGVNKIVRWFEAIEERKKIEQKNTNIYEQEGPTQIPPKKPYTSPMAQAAKKHRKIKKMLEQQDENGMLPPEETPLEEGDPNEGFEDGEFLDNEYLDEEGGDEVEIEFINEDGRPPPPPTAGLEMRKGGGGSSMQDLMAKAKAMQRERDETLGYDENKLPRYE